jgi:hypothetical protein
MIGGEDNAIQFLVGLGVLDSGDAARIKQIQAGAIVEVLIEKEVLSPAYIKEAKSLLEKIIRTSNHLKRMRFQMELMRLITGKMHERMEASAQKIHEHRKRVTSDGFPAVPAVAGLAKAAGD